MFELFFFTFRLAVASAAVAAKIPSAFTRQLLACSLSASFFFFLSYVFSFSGNDFSFHTHTHTISSDFNSLLLSRNLLPLSLVLLTLLLFYYVHGCCCFFGRFEWLFLLPQFDALALLVIGIEQYLYSLNLTIILVRTHLPRTPCLPLLLSLSDGFALSPVRKHKHTLHIYVFIVGTLYSHWYSLFVLLLVPWRAFVIFAAHFS